MRNIIFFTQSFTSTETALYLGDDEVPMVHARLRIFRIRIGCVFFDSEIGMER